MLLSHVVNVILKCLYTEHIKFSQYFNDIFFVIQNTILIFLYIEICMTEFVAFIKRVLNSFNILTKKLFTLNDKQLFFNKGTIVRKKLLETVLINRHNSRE